MKVKKIPMRMCAVTRERFPKSELIRIVKTPQNEIKVDLTGKMNGHGIYIKKDKEVLMKAIKSNVLGRTLEANISSDVYEELENIIK